MPRGSGLMRRDERGSGVGNLYAPAIDGRDLSRLRDESVRTRLTSVGCLRTAIRPLPSETHGMEILSETVCRGWYNGRRDFSTASASRRSQPHQQGKVTEGRTPVRNLRGV